MRWTVAETQDAAGRDIGIGDRVGGVTSGRYQETIIGPIVKIGKTQVKITVEKSSRGRNGALGDEKWISPDRVFLVEKAVDRG